MIGTPPFTGVTVTLKLVAGIVFTALSYVHMKVTVRSSKLFVIVKSLTGFGGPTCIYNDQC